MNTYQERRKISLDRRKRQIVQNWFSSFVVTVVVVVAVVVLAPPKVEASFLRIEPFGSNLFYQVQIIDEGSTITPGSLKVKVESPLETYENEIPLGISSGSFEGLKPGTRYTVSIVAKRGFGEEVLQSETAVTETGYGGRIVSTSYEVVDLGTSHEEMYHYSIVTSFNDRLNEINQVWLEYAYMYEYIEGVTPLPSEQDLEIFEIFTYQQTTRIEYVMGYNGILFLRLKALLNTQEEVILDQIFVNTPIHIEGSVYIEDVGPRNIKASLYLDFDILPDIQYFVRLIRNGITLQEQYIVESHSNTHNQGYQIEFSNLNLNSYYHVVLFASYTDPITLTKVERLIINERVSTTKEYQLQVTHQIINTEYIIYVHLVDEYDVIRNINLVIYDTSTGYPSWVTSSNIILQNIGNNQYEGTINIPIPNFASYQVIVYVDKYAQVDQIYYYVNVYEIIKD